MPRTPPTRSEHPPRWKFDYPIFHAETIQDWRGWLESNHETARGVWLASWKRDTGKPRLTYDEIVEEALCFGWIDATINTLDDERLLNLVTPRKAKSIWSRVNKRRIEELRTQGRLRPAGLRAIEVAKENGWWTVLEPVEDLIEPDELASALDAVPEAREHWDAFPPSAKKVMLWWVVSAVKNETRDKRIAAIVSKAAKGQRAKI